MTNGEAFALATRDIFSLHDKAKDVVRSFAVGLRYEYVRRITKARLRKQKIKKFVPNRVRRPMPFGTMGNNCSGNILSTNRKIFLRVAFLTASFFYSFRALCFCDVRVTDRTMVVTFLT
jgi:hypothetical protein